MSIQNDDVSNVDTAERQQKVKKLNPEDLCVGYQAAIQMAIYDGQLSWQGVHSQFFVNYLTTRRIFSNFLFLILSWSSLLYFSTILS